MIIEIFVNGKWDPCLKLDIHEEKKSFESSCSFSYEMDYFDLYGQFEGSKGIYSVSCLEELDLVLRSKDKWPSFIFDLIPQGVARKIVCQRLGIANIAENDFQILKEGAINPIGNLRIQNTIKLFEQDINQEKNFSLKEIAEKKEEFLEHAISFGALVAGGTGAQGMAPKYLMNQDNLGRWTCDGSLKDEFIKKSFIVKLSKSSAKNDKLILESEEKYMDIAIECGLNVNAPLKLIDEMLIIPRFDRIIKDNQLIRLGQESMASLLGHTDFGVSSFLEDYCHIIKKYSSSFKEDILEFIKRDLFNIALGNTDNHGRNFAFLKTSESNIRLSPLFDFAPMVIDPEGIARVSKWKHEKDYIPNFEQLMTFLINLEFEEKELFLFFDESLFQLEKLDDLLVKYKVNKEVIELATRKKDNLILALKKLRGK